MTARLEGEDFADYKARRKVENDGHKTVRFVLDWRTSTRSHVANDNRRKRRALVKAMGARQFKIQTRKST